MNKQVAIVAFLVICTGTLFFSGCSKAATTSRPTPKIQQDTDEARKLLSEAERYYGDGVIFNMRGQWVDARNSFDKALNLISQLDLEEAAEISQEVDNLLREIAYDYKFTLSQAETLTVVSAPVVLSLALSDAPFSELTQKRLKQLQSVLPSLSDKEVEETPHDYPIVMNDRVREKIVFFQTQAKEPMTKWLGRMHRHLPMVRKIFAEEGLPLDLAYLPLIESGYNAEAYSWAHAVGIWQFIKSTGRGYNLEINWWVDERRDPEKSTRAAAKYLKKLYNMFNDWHLALAAYNCGEGRVSRTMAKTGVNNYWDLSLPTETKNYVPLFIAALLIAKNPAQYGFETVDNLQPLLCDVVMVNEVVDLKLAAKCAESDFTTMKSLNPELVRQCTPPNAQKYPLKVPKGAASIFVQNYKDIPEAEKVAWTRHEVKSGESFWSIARRYGTSVQALMDANSLKDSKSLKPGMHLLIPIAGVSDGKYAGVSDDDEPDSKPNKQSKTASPSANTPSAKPSQYTVQSGDTPDKIAREHGVSTTTLLSANGLAENDIIHVGQQLKIPGVTKSKSSERLTHTVLAGESLWSIARKYGVTVSQIRTWNNMQSDKLSAGMVLSIGSGDATKSTDIAKSSTRATSKYHTVKTGENLWSIARQYDITISELKDWNNLTSDKLDIGSKLIIRSSETVATKTYGDAKVVTHTVARGETIWKIAQKYNTTTSEIIARNNLEDASKLKPGDRLTIVLQ